MSDYAIQVMVGLYIAERQENDGLLSVQALAERLHLEAPTVSKVLKLLARKNLVRSIRGAHGGYLLEDPNGEISVADIIAAIEGPIAMTECAVEDHNCGQQSVCGLSANWRRISEAVAGALASVSLGDMAGPVGPRRIPGLRIETRIN